MLPVAPLAAVSFAGAALLAGCSAPHPQPQPQTALPRIAAAPGTPRPPFDFAPADDALLNDITRGAFNAIWKPVNATGMVPDRTSKPSLVSVAGVGFQLSAFCIGVERGWVTRAEAEARALRIVRALDSQTSNRRFGMFFHFIDGETGAFPSGTPEDDVSTIDSALLFAGLLTAGEYFGGEIRTIGDRIFAGADWRAFVITAGVPEYERNAISLAWAPRDPKNPQGPGKFKPYAWVDAGDEHRLVTFLAVASPNPAHRVDPSMYYRLRRPLGEHRGTTMVFLPWSGAHFVNFFAHCWIDYAGMPADDPAGHGFPTRPEVDWWENSRRQTLLQKDKAIDAAGKLPNLGPDSWGLSASDCPTGYCVPGVYPTPLHPAGQRSQWDYPEFTPKDDLADGTVSPYAAVCSILFEPGLALAAAHAMRRDDGTDGRAAIWRNPKTGGTGFVDSYNRTQGPKGWVAAEDLAIDQGPTALMVENARTGLISGLFHRHRWVREAGDRLGWPASAGAARKKDPTGR